MYEPKARIGLVRLVLLGFFVFVPTFLELVLAFLAFLSPALIRVIRGTDFGRSLFLLTMFSSIKKSAYNFL
jgi:hypothetical protein